MPSRTATCLVVFILFAVSGCTAGGGAAPVLSPFEPATPMPSASLASGRVVSRVALGSCFHPSMPAGIFDTIRAASPDLFVFLGDNVYAADESDDPQLLSLRQAYADLASVQSFSRLRAYVPVEVIWDDHDYGLDDAGADFAHRAFSESLYEYVWALEAGDPRRSRPGVYFEKTIGPPGRRLQLIAIDNRYFRSPLTRNPGPGGGRYLPSEDPAQRLLGEDQWRWLEAALTRPADVRLLITPIQLIADGHQWEAWAMMPAERERFHALLRRVRPEGLVVVSGDRHSAALYRRSEGLPYPLVELTTSSLNVPLTSFVPDPVDEPGPYRLTKPWYESNFGLVDINWDAGTVTLSLADETGRQIHALTVNLAELRAID